MVRVLFEFEEVQLSCVQAKLFGERCRPALFPVRGGSERFDLFEVSRSRRGFRCVEKRSEATGSEGLGSQFPFGAFREGARGYQPGGN